MGEEHGCDVLHGIEHYNRAHSVSPFGFCEGDIGCSTKVHLNELLLGRVEATYRTILPWMAQETQYCSLRYILGTVYSGNTDASEISPMKRTNILAKSHNFVKPPWHHYPLSHFVSSSSLYSNAHTLAHDPWTHVYEILVHTNSCRLDHVADGESLDCLILWSTS